MRYKNKQKLVQTKIYLAGAILVLIFSGILLYAKLSRDYEEAHATISLEDSESGKKVEGFYDIKEYLEYLENALESNDVDKYLRGCAIQEKVSNYPFGYYMNQSDKFSFNAAYLPSNNYDEYEPINQLIISRDFLIQYNSLKAQFKKLSGNNSDKFKIIKVGILKSEDQKTQEYLRHLKSRANRWNADYFIEMTALIKSGNKYYTFCFTLVRYDQCYKLFNLQSNLSDWDSDDYVKKTTKSKFNKLYSDVDPDKFSSYLEKKVMDEIPEKKEKNEELTDAQEATLQLNYSVIDQKYCNTPKSCISHFLLEIIRHNPMKALNYCYSYDTTENIDDVIEKEGSMALQLSYLYKSLSDFPYSNTFGIDYSYLDFSSDEVSENIDPKALHTMTVAYISGTGFDNEYIAVVSYNNQYYKLGFTVIQTEKGWMIASLSADRNEISPGEAIKTES